jgi:hypothetical protein
MSVMSAAEFVLWAALCFLFWKKNLQRRFPAMGAYLALKVFSTPVLLVFLYVQSQPWGRAYYLPYFLGFWTVYIACTALLFFICMEVFRSALSAFPGLMKFGLVIFRWVVLASVIVTLSSISFAHRGVLVIPDVAASLMRSVSILELCLLAFLCLCMNALRLSVRDVAFGISLGLGVMAANDFIASSLISQNSVLTEPLQLAYEAVVLGALGTWAIYCALPEPARQTMVMPVNSTIYRWNEIASALGHPVTQVAVQQQAGSFFLTDVEQVVDKVLTRTLKSNESES